MSVTPTFSGEVQLRRYSDTSSQGVQVVFALPDREALEPLIPKVGKRFMAVLVEIGDDEAPVEPQPRKDQRGPLCREACDLCRMPEFGRWIDTLGPRETIGARAFVLTTCGITSRKELDEDQSAGIEFVQRIRIPFMRYMQAKKT